MSKVETNYPADGPHVGSGVGLVPACPTHGWVCALLDARDEALKAAEVEVERLTAALREIANDPVEALVVKSAREALAGKETTP